jgi:hypothetical protein
MFDSEFVVAAGNGSLNELLDDAQDEFVGGNVLGQHIEFIGELCLA